MFSNFFSKFRIKVNLPNNPFTSTVNDIPLDTIYNGPEKEEVSWWGNIEINIASGNITKTNTSKTTVPWMFHAAREIYKNADIMHPKIGREETDPLRITIKNYIQTVWRKNVDLASVDSKRWKKWYKLFEEDGKNGKKEFVISIPLSNNVKGGHKTKHTKKHKTKHHR